MRNLRILAPAIALLLFIATSAHGQKNIPELDIFVEGGGSFLNGGSGQLPAPSFPCPAQGIPCPTPSAITMTSSFSKTGRLVAGARLRFTRHDALEASYSFSPNHLTLQGTEVLTFPGTGLSERIPLSVSSYNRDNLVSFNYVRYLWTRSPIQPFITGGLGFNRFSGSASGSAVVAALISASNGFQFAWNLGAGTDIVLQRHFALRLDLRDYLTGQPGLINGTSYNIVPSAGMVFRFR